MIISRQNFLKAMGFGSVACAALAMTGCSASSASSSAAGSSTASSASGTDGVYWSGNDADAYTLDLLCDSADVASSLDTTVGKELYRKFGIAFNYVGFSGDIKQQQSMMLAGQTYNEMMYLNENDIVGQYISAGVLLNLDDYKDILPDFYKFNEKSIPYWRAVDTDGALRKWEITIPRIGDHLDMMVRTDVLEKYGWPSLVSASDWLDFLEKAVKDFPTAYDGQPTSGMTLPMAESWGLYGTPPIMPEKGDTYVEFANDYPVYNAKEGKLEDMTLIPEAKESFKFFHDAYQRGILDTECFTDTVDMTQSKMSNGSAISVFYVSWLNGTANAALTDAGHPEMSYIQLPIQLDSQYKAGQKRELTKAYSYPFQSWALTDKCKDPERLLTFLNWCYTEEGLLLLNSGIKDVHYTVDSDGVRQATDLVKNAAINNTLQDEGLNVGNGAVLHGLPETAETYKDGKYYNLCLEGDFTDLLLTDREKEAFQKLGWKDANAWWEDNAVWYDPGFGLNVSLDADSEEAQIGTKMAEVRAKYTADMITKEDFEATYQAMVDEYNTLDHDSVIKALNDKLAAMNATLK